MVIEYYDNGAPKDKTVHINSYKLKGEQFMGYFTDKRGYNIRGSVNEDHLPMVDVKKPVLQAEH